MYASLRPSARLAAVISSKDFFDALTRAGISFYAGVPDSLLKDFCAYVTDHAPRSRHIITANEGSAVGLAAGHHLATGGIGLVYMQNSGLGNAINPLTSLADPAVYGIPMLVVIGWRGEPGHKDEPQHVHMGSVTIAALEGVGVPHAVLSDDPSAVQAQLAEAMQSVRARSAPYALVVRKGTFGKYALKSKEPDEFALTREQAIVRFVEALPPGALIVSTTGMPSRELFEVREARKEPHASDFLTVGCMGHASQIALGVALEQPGQQVYCLDGDGAVLMHMGGLATIGTLSPRNYKHVVLNNGAHDSVGGQPTVGFEVDLCAVARACRYESATSVSDDAELVQALADLASTKGPAMLEVRVRKGARDDLGRPTMKPADLKRAFMTHVGIDVDRLTRDG